MSRQNKKGPAIKDNGEASLAPFSLYGVGIATAVVFDATLSTPDPSTLFT